MSKRIYILFILRLITMSVRKSLFYGIAYNLKDATILTTITTAISMAVFKHYLFNS